MVVIKTKNFNSICASEFWVDKRVVVEITCLMPNGAFIPLSVDINSTFLEIKEVIAVYYYYLLYLFYFISIKYSG